MDGAPVIVPWAPEALADLGVSRETPLEDHGMGSFWMTFLGFLPGNIASKAASRGSMRNQRDTLPFQPQTCRIFPARSIVIALSMT